VGKKGGTVREKSGPRKESHQLVRANQLHQNVKKQVTPLIRQRSKNGRSRYKENYLSKAVGGGTARTATSYPQNYNSREATEPKSIKKRLSSPGSFRKGEEIKPEAFHTALFPEVRSRRQGKNTEEEL